ncbi:MAG: sulfite exporter TauE/SafE family protein [Bacteroidota bacterium]
MILLFTSFILGLTANLHCLGMCGPLVLAIPLDRTSRRSTFSGILQYNAGRIAAYAGLGALAGVLGLGVRSFGFLQWLSILSGFFILVYAWKKWLFRSQPGKTLFSGFGRFFGKAIGRILASGSRFKLPLLGTLNGLLPCGMVYLALLNAILGGDSAKSALAMVFFGLGTLPALVFVAYAANRVSPQLRLTFSRTVPALLTVVALLMILRGMNLGIPYLSPKVSHVAGKTTEKPAEIKVSCCHAPHPGEH